MHLAKVKLKIVNPFAAGRKGEVGGGVGGVGGRTVSRFPSVYYQYVSQCPELDKTESYYTRVSNQPHFNLSYCIGEVAPWPGGTPI